MMLVPKPSLKYPIDHPGTQWGFVEELSHDSQENPDDLDEDGKIRGEAVIVDCSESNVAISRLENGNHLPMIDMDYPVVLVPSSTKGHHHLYIGKELTTDQYDQLLECLVDVGLMQEGFYMRFLQDGHTALRLPWVKKVKEYQEDTAEADLAASLGYGDGDIMVAEF